MASSHSIIIQLFRCRKIVLEMLEERGFNVEHLKNYSIDMIREMKDSSDDDITRQLNIYVKDEERDRRCCVIFVLKSKFKKSNANDMIEQVLDEDYQNRIYPEKDDCVFISLYPIKETGMEAINNIYTEHKVNAQVFYIKELLYNPLHHVLVPKFRILSKEEIEKVKNKYHVQRLNQFPLIKKHDAIAKFIGIRIGDVVEITNKSRNGGTNIYYRYCDN
jgi:DNA-directed RNA polymerase subunit H (RpoH/RPB5)